MLKKITLVTLFAVSLVVGASGAVNAKPAVDAPSNPPPQGFCFVSFCM